MATKQLSIKQALAQENHFLKAGSAISIDIITPAGQKGRFKSTFIGFMPNEYLLIECPDMGKLGNFSQHVVKGMKIAVRGLVEGQKASIIGFMSLIEQTVTMPSRMIVLSFPKAVSIHNLRATKRVDTELKVTVNLGTRSWPAVMNDVSLTGCHLVMQDCTQKSIPEDSDISIAIGDESGEADEVDRDTVIAKVCNVKQDEQGFQLGCQFAVQQQQTIDKLIHIALLAEK
ncbi:flagellar brake protein [Shewanella maritima]|uniref:Flagellar brake protein n=1 Tax=Shewanella maritima TaxID=2520507 RepID=A0A411PKJ6_9GAMM|nr:PilZ domain-containing protein [Shewanella maritima]QBF84041.1 flagellar brake protein [Shewanella maritima]